MSPFRLQRDGAWLVALSAVAVHAPALAAGFVWLDRAHIQGGLAWAPLGEWTSLFTRPFAGTGFYRPLVGLAFSIDAVISSAPSFMHAVTLAWHALAALFVLWAARALGSTVRASFIAALAFAVHPLNTLVASAISFRSEAMSLVFLLALVVSHQRTKALFAGLALVGCALTKESAWLLSPLVLLLLEIGGGPRISSAGLAPKRRLLLTEVLAFTLASGVRLCFAPPWRATFAALAWDEQLGARLAALGKGFARALLPWPNTVCDAFAVVSVVSPLSLLGLMVIVWLLLTRAASRPRVLLLLASLLPCAQLVPVMRWWSPHYFYVPLAFAAITFCDALERRLYPASPPPTKSSPVASRALVIVALALSVRSLSDSLRFRDDRSLWSYEVAQEPACREGQFYLGEVAREAGDFALAARRYRRAARPTAGVLAYADEFSAYQNLGAVEFAQRHVAEARSAFEQAWQRGGTEEQRAQASHNLLLTEVLSLTRPSHAAVSQGPHQERSR